MALILSSRPGSPHLPWGRRLACLQMCRGKRCQNRQKDTELFPYFQPTTEPRPETRSPALCHANLQSFPLTLTTSPAPLPASPTGILTFPAPCCLIPSAWPALSPTRASFHGQEGNSKCRKRTRASVPGLPQPVFPGPARKLL